jgi:4-hydroxy-tetrahydrodipicolinate reductase
MVNIAIAGAGGRMGRMLIEAVLASTRLPLTAALDLPGSPALGQDAGAFAGRRPAWPSRPTCAPAWPAPTC